MKTLASFRKYHGTWQYRVTYKVGKKYKQKSASGFRTKAEAKIAAADMETNIKHGAQIDKSNMMFSDYIKNWYETFRKGKKSERNDEDIDRTVRFVKDAFAGVRMKELTREVYQRALNGYAETHATASVSKRHIYMKACLREAIEDGIIFRDPTFKAIVKGKKPNKPEESKYIGFMDAKRLGLYMINRLDLRYISRHMILFGLASGCRLAEILGLTWDCIDFKNQTVRIYRAWDYRKKHTFCKTKNEASKRVIKIDNVTINWLKKLKKEQQETFGRRHIENKNNLVFVNDRCQQVSDNACIKALKKACRRIGCTEISMHGLRHTHASILLYQGVNINYVSRRLGHSSVVTTLKIYTHILDELKQRDAETSQMIIGGLFTVDKKKNTSLENAG